MIDDEEKQDGLQTAGGVSEDALEALGEDTEDEDDAAVDPLAEESEKDWM